jgi:hypothetical protein
MGASVIAVRACCPLCGSPVLSVGRAGKVLGEDLHPIQLGQDAGRGYSLCDDCAILTDLPDDLTLN